MKIRAKALAALTFSGFTSESLTNHGGLGVYAKVSEETIRCSTRANIILGLLKTPVFLNKKHSPKDLNFLSKK